MLAIASIIGLGQITDSLDKIITFSSKYFTTDSKSNGNALPTKTVDIVLKQKTPDSNNNIKNNLNPDYKRRDKILGISVDWGQQKGGIYEFDDLSRKELSLLIEENFIDLNEKQNEAPSTKDFLKFIEDFPQFTIGGYAVSPSRKDYRVTLNALISPDTNLTPELVDSFLEFCIGADDINRYLVCWWD